jgi:hypothetical protein
MSILDRYRAYADAFERSYEDDDWSHIEPFFTENASYTAGEPHAHSTVTTKWRGTYTKAGLPDLVISGVEEASFEGDRIVLLSGTFDPEAQKALGQWMAQHGAALAG